MFNLIRTALAVDAHIEGSALDREVLRRKKERTDNVAHLLSEGAVIRRCRTTTFHASYHELFKLCDRLVIGCSAVERNGENVDTTAGVLPMPEMAKKRFDQALALLG